MTVDWKIEKLECKVLENGLTNIVYQIQCICRVTDVINTKSYTSAKRTIISLLSPDSENFIEFEDLTKPQIVEWIEDALGENLSILTTELSTKNSLLANPITISLDPPFDN